ncbi:MAG: hypothetical protein HRU26_06920 [Psychroserpens sp.]|nr:hypothetical protein [Psychroserpens sp.]
MNFENFKEHHGFYGWQLKLNDLTQEERKLLSWCKERHDKVEADIHMLLFHASKRKGEGKALKEVESE